MLIIFLSISLFQSLLTFEKILIGLFLLLICLIALWFFSFPPLQYANNFWLFHNISKNLDLFIAPIIDSSLLFVSQKSTMHLQTIENQYHIYCRLI